MPQTKVSNARKDKRLNRFTVMTRVTVKDTSYVPSHNHRRKHSYTAPILKTQQQDTTSSPGSSFYLSLLLTSFLEASHQGPSPAW